MKRVVLALSLLLPGAGAWAQTAEDCRAFTDEKLRLACFQQAAKPKAQAPKVRPPQSNQNDLNQAGSPAGSSSAGLSPARASGSGSSRGTDHRLIPNVTVRPVLATTYHRSRVKVSRGHGGSHLFGRRRRH